MPQSGVTDGTFVIAAKGAAIPYLVSVKQSTDGGFNRTFAL